MNFIKCSDEKTKQQLLQQGFKLMGTECIKNKKVYLFINSKEVNLTNKNVIESNKLFF